MGWHADTASDYRDLLTRIVKQATSKYVSAVVLNAPGTGYTAGDILSITGFSGDLKATVEVLTIGGGGAVSTYKLRSMGAYADRAASAVVAAGGSGYAVGDILQLVGGTSTCKAKFRVATLGGGSDVATVTLFEGGGAYTSEPTNDVATLKVGPLAGTGSGCTLTVTWSGLVGTTGAAVTGGTGGDDATFDLTLTVSGWSAVRDLNKYSFNSVTDEKEVVLLGTVGGGDPPYVGFRSYTATVGINTRYGIVLVGMTSHNIGVAFGSQSGIGPTTGTPGTNGAYIPLLPPASMPYWLSVSPRKINWGVKTQGSSVLAYQTGYVGLMNPFGTATENPLPLFIAGSAAVHDTAPDAATNQVTGLTEAVSGSGASGPLWFRRITDATWVEVKNSENGVENTDHVLYPVGRALNVSGGNGESNIVTDSGFEWWQGIALNTGAVATKKLFPSPNTGGDLAALIPVTLVRTPSATNGVTTDVHGELDGVFWISGTKEDGTVVTPEDTVTISGVRYRIFPCAHRRERYSFMAFQEA